jgi:hypothetical protein
MHLYSASVLPRRGRGTVTLPHRTGRPARTAPRSGPISATCRCGQERSLQESLRPGRDCARCSALTVL